MLVAVRAVTAPRIASCVTTPFLFLVTQVACRARASRSRAASFFLPASWSATEGLLTRAAVAASTVVPLPAACWLLPAAVVVSGFEQAVTENAVVAMTAAVRTLRVIERCNMFPPGRDRFGATVAGRSTHCASAI